MSPAVVIRSPLRALVPGLVAILAAFVPAPAAARTWHLTPGGGDAPTIQSAIDQSDDGDTLALATGFYSERIRIVNKTLLVQGAGMERTTLSGTDLQSAHGHTVELRGSNNFTEIRDLTIRDGNANQSGQPDGGIYGGGVLGVEAFFALIRCRVVDNSCSSLGGGVYATSIPFAGGGNAPRPAELRPRRAATPGPRGYVLLEECVLENNFGGSEGGGACFDLAWFVVERCTFRHNFAGQGGGLVALNSIGTASLSLFLDNEGLLDGGGVKLDTALATTATTVRVFQNTFVRNKADRYGSGLLLSSGETFEVSANLFDGQAGGAFSVLGCANAAVYAGGCNHFGANASPPVDGCPPIDTDTFGPPSFCDADGGDYRVCTNSLAAVSSGNCATARGIGIGCAGEACATAIRPATWSGIKLLVR